MRRFPVLPALAQTAYDGRAKQVAFLGCHVDLLLSTNAPCPASEPRVL